MSAFSGEKYVMPSTVGMPLVILTEPVCLFQFQITIMVMGCDMGRPRRFGSQSLDYVDDPFLFLHFIDCNYINVTMFVTRE